MQLYGNNAGIATQLIEFNFIEALRKHIYGLSDITFSFVEDFPSIQCSFIGWKVYQFKINEASPRPDFPLNSMFIHWLESLSV